jgi:23S rRNA (guanosine2251-2'-O)-methyltransferase
VVPQRRQALERLVLHATSLRIPVVEVEGGTLTAIAGFDGHQGIALIVAPRRWAAPDDILAVAASRAEAPLVLVLDSLEDPQNVGTLLRTAEASGVHGAVFPTRHQAPLSPSAVKASAGAVEHLALAPVDDLPGTLADLHARGVRIVGADGEAPLSAREADLRGPIAIVVGSEGKGLGPAVRRRCDLLVRIPMHGRIDSLNAAVAGSILLYEAAAQRRLPDPGPRTSASGAEAGATADTVSDGGIDVGPGEAESTTTLAPDEAAAEPPTEEKPTRARRAKAAEAAEATEAAPEEAAAEPPTEEKPTRARRAKAVGTAEAETAPAEVPAESPAGKKPARKPRASATKAAEAEGVPPTAPPDKKPARARRAKAAEAAEEPVSDDDGLLPGMPAASPPEV